MKGMRRIKTASATPRSVRRSSVAGAFVMALVASTTLEASAQQPNPAAKKLFDEAFKDEQEGRCEDALRKFQELSKTTNTAPVRYRIAKTQECLGHFRDARDNMRALAASKSDLPAKDKPIADSAASEVVDI